MIRVGILRGGAHDHYNGSLKSGAHIIRSLPKEVYEPVDIFVDRQGLWHLGGLPVSHDALRRRVDVVWNTLSGYFGEDGKLQTLFEAQGIPYTGSDPLPSAIAMNKKLSKEHFKRLGVKTPRHIFIEGTEEGTLPDPQTVAREVFQQLSPPWIVKPVSGINSEDTVRCNTRTELEEALENMYSKGVESIIEEYVFGKEITVDTIAGFRGQKHYTLLPVEIKTPKGKIFDTEMKTSDLAERIVPGRFSKDESDAIQALARTIHEGLRLGHYSRTDMILTPRGEIYVLETNTMIPMHEESTFVRSLGAVGSSFKEFAEHLLASVLKKK